MMGKRCSQQNASDKKLPSAELTRDCLVPLPLLGRKAGISMLAQVIDRTLALGKAPEMDIVLDGGTHDGPRHAGAAHSSPAAKDERGVHAAEGEVVGHDVLGRDRKSTRLNSSH